LKYFNKNKIGSYSINTKYGKYDFFLLSSGNLEIVHPPYNKIDASYFIFISPLIIKRIELDSGFDRIILLERL
jgi:hypothetical protein